MPKNIKRREFLKYSAVGASALALSQYLGASPTAQTDDRPFVDRCTGKKVQGTPGVCTGCGANCGIIAYVRGGQLMKIGGNHVHPVNKGTLCLVGGAGIYRLYDPERVQKPMVRIGKRGQNRWKEIGWDEAVDTVSEKIKHLKGRGLILETSGGSTELASREFLSKMGTGTLVSHGRVVSPGREAALMEMFGVRFDVPDIANTAYVLNFGANPYESDPFGIGTISAMTTQKSKRGGLKLVTFDPRLSATAGKSDEWFPLLPGTDAVVALAMAAVIMNEGLHDKDFIERHTNTTAEALRAHLANYTPASAERISGVPQDDIRRIAVEYAASERAVLLTGGGVSKHAQGALYERAVRLLPVITGKIGRTGCNLLPAWSGAEGGPDVAAKTPETFYAKLQDGSQRVGVYILHGSDPAYSSPASDKMAKVLGDETAVQFLVSIGTHVTDSGLYADMVLPMSTYLEEYGLEVSPGPGAAPIVGYRQPVVQPQGDSRPYTEILVSIAEKSGAALSFSDSEEYTDLLISKAGLSAAAAQELPVKGFAALSRPAPGIKEKINAASKKGVLPSFSQPGEYKDMKPGEFVLVPYSPGTYREGFTENNLLLKEISHDSRAFINSASGSAMGLKSWDRAALVSPAGKIEVTVMLTPGIHPKTIALARGCGHAGYGKIENAEKFKSPDPFTDVIWWEGDGKGSNVNRIIPFNLDRESGGQGWMLTKITVEVIRGAKNG
jgi:anaerobic selenocysteine-containing dehydrogenase